MIAITTKSSINVKPRRNFSLILLLLVMGTNEKHTQPMWENPNGSCEPEKAAERKRPFGMKGCQRVQVARDATWSPQNKSCLWVVDRIRRGKMQKVPLGAQNV